MCPRQSLREAEPAREPERLEETLGAGDGRAQLVTRVCVCPRQSLRRSRRA